MRTGAVTALSLLVTSFLAFVPPAGAQPARFAPGDTAVGSSAGSQDRPAIAAGAAAGGERRTLVAWSDAHALLSTGAYEGETSSDIYAQVFDAGGAPLHRIPFAVSAAAGAQSAPKIAWNGTNWLVVFQSTALSGTGYYYQTALAAVRVSSEGKVLDARHIPIPGVSASGQAWALASDGNNWVIAVQGTSVSNDIIAVRIGPDGTVLDPPTRSLVKSTYYQRSNLKLAYADNVFLLTFNDSGSGYVTKAVRFDSGLNALDADLLPLINAQLDGLAGQNGSGFYAVWNQQLPDYSLAILGSRVSAEGQALDGNGKNISGAFPPQAFSTTSLAWDGLNWRVTWGNNNSLRAARVNASGQVLDPGGVAVAGPKTGITAGTGNGGIQVVWSEFANNTYDVLAANVSSSNTATANRTVSASEPAQLHPAVAAGASGYMMAYRSTTGNGLRILAQPLDASGEPVTAEPIELDSGAAPSGVGAPAVAWNGSVYLVSWGNASGVVAQRLSQSGAKIDAAPFVVLNPGFGKPAVAALGEAFLVVGRKFGFTPQYIHPIAARVDGATGQLLDTSPIALGATYASTPVAAALGGRWLVVWRDNASHDDPYARTVSTFIDASGAVAAAYPYTTVHGPYSSAGGNGIFTLGLASSGSVAMMVQSQELTSGVETDLLARLIDAAGVVSPMFNLTPWTGNQYRPDVAWDGKQFVVAFQDQKNRFTEWGLEQLDARSDLFGMRVTADGTIVDPQGFVFSRSETAEAFPAIASLNGVSLIAGSIVRPSSAAYRAGYSLFGPGGNQWPVAVASANPVAGDVPIQVAFDASGSFDPDGSIASYAWDFGDGSTGSGPGAVHTYTAGGPYVATLTATDDRGAKSSQAVLVKVVAPNQAPVAKASATPTSGPAPLYAVLSAAGSYDPDGAIGNVRWTFSDGGEYWGATAYHTFATEGQHTATVTVYDSRGATASDTVTFNVGPANKLPVAVVSAAPTSGTAPFAVSFSSAGSSDPDGSIVAYKWIFGDGGSSTEPNPAYTYATAGAFTAMLTVTDNNGGTGSASVVISVQPGPCVTLCLRATDVSVSAPKGKRGTDITAKVSVADENGAGVQFATVFATWTTPSGTKDVFASTGRKGGSVSFSTPAAGAGTYTLAVTDIVKTGYRFDADQSALSGSVTLAR